MIDNIKNVGNNLYNMLKQKYSELKKNFNIAIAGIISIFLFMFTPDKFYFILFFAFFYIVVNKALDKIANIQNLLAIDFEKNNVALVQLSQKRLNDYNIIDEDGKPASLLYKLKGQKQNVFIADGISSKHNIIVVNDITSNVDFIKNYKEIDIMLKKEVNKLQHEVNKLKAELEFKTLQHASKIYDSHPILNLLSNSRGDNNG